MLWTLVIGQEKLFYLVTWNSPTTHDMQPANIDQSSLLSGITAMFYIFSDPFSFQFSMEQFTLWWLLKHSLFGKR